YESRLGDVGRAIDTYQAVLDRSPTHRGALESLARLFESKGELPRAAEALEKLLQQSTGQDAVKLAIRLSELFPKLKDERSAERALEQGLAQEPTNAEIRKRLAQTYERTREWGRLAELIAADADATSQPAEKVRLYRSAAQLYTAQQNDPASAAGLLEKAST